MRCLHSILGVSLWNGQRDTSIDVDPELSTSLRSHHAHAGGSPTKATAGVCTSPCGRSAGGQKLRWNDQVGVEGSAELQSRQRMEGTDP